jgi:ABC-type sugar transport system ATPase subunit
MAPPLLRLDAVGKQFPGVRALTGVSFSLEPGEIVGLVGENGAGKSTLLKIVGGVYGEYEGGLWRGERRVRFRSAADALAAGIAVVHQELSLIPALTVAENLVLGREPRRFGLVDDAALEARARGMLEQVLNRGPAIDPVAKVSDLGLAEQQLVEITRAFAADARVVILDEPTAALTSAEAERLHGLIRAGAARGTAFVFVSHRLDEIFTVTDRIIVLRDGRLVADRPTWALDVAQVTELMTGQSVDRLARPSPNRAAGAAVLTIDRLGLAHPTRPGQAVLRDVHLEVRAGEIVALAGAMGAGRTALLSTLFGLARGTVSGRMTLAGAPYAPKHPRAAIARGVALVPEDRKHQGLALGQSVADNLTLASLPARFVDVAAAERAATDRARALAIKAPALAALVDTLSGGNQQKVVLGKWLEAAPRLLLLDEPTRGVDVGARAEIFRLLRALTEDGLAILMASSDLEEIRVLADRAVVLQGGAVAGELGGAALGAHALMTLAVGRASAMDQAPARAQAPRQGAA